MNTEREWLAALVLQYVDTNNSSIRKGLDKIIDESNKNNQAIRSTINALATETMRRKNLIDRIANRALDQCFQLKQSSIPSLKRMDSKLRNFLRIIIYRLKFENHKPDLVFHTSNSIISNLYPNAKDYFNQILSIIIEIDLNEFLNTIEDPIEKLALKTWEPYFLVNRFYQIFGETSNEILEYFQKNSPVYIRINYLKNPDVAFDELRKNNVIFEKDEYMPDVFKVIKSEVPIARLDGFKNGFFYIQSRSSCFITYFLNPLKNEKILDACSAPGSKTTHISSLTNNSVFITALEVDSHRIEMLKKTLLRSDVNSVNIIQTDAREAPFDSETIFDKILLDAPCSGSGTLSTKTHAKWRIKGPLIKKYSQLQFEILKKVSTHLKKGGLLLYSTCSLLPEENENIIGKFLTENKNFEPRELKFPSLGEKIAFHGKRLLPQIVDSEGFSVFLLEKVT